MPINTRILKYSLLAGAIYFASVATVHMLGIKLPILFVFFDVPSHAYQDRIISFMAFGWAAWLFTTSTDPVKYCAMVKAILIAGAVAIAELSLINATTDFQSLSPSIRVETFWAETFGLFIYWLWLVIFYLRSNLNTEN